MDEPDLFDELPNDNRPNNDWFVVVIVGIVCTLVVLGAFAVLKNQRWLENPGEYVIVPSPVVTVRTEYVSSPSPSPVVKRITKTETVTPSPATVTATETVTVQAPGRGMSEACIEALYAADAMRKAIEQGGDIDAAVYAYEVFRSMCKGL